MARARADLPSPPLTDSQQALVMEHRAWAHRIASAHHGRRGLPPWLTRELFLSAADLALCRAARLYRAQDGVPFTAYAAPFVVNSMLREQSEHHPWGRQAGRRAVEHRDAPTDAPDQLDGLAHGREPCDGEALAAEARLQEADRVRAALHRLSPTDRHLLVLRYYLELSQRETGLETGVSQMQVSRREKAALARLREALAAE